jgi:site-specific recombinase XerD
MKKATNALAQTKPASAISKCQPLTPWERESLQRKTPARLGEPDRVGLMEDFLVYGRARGYSNHTLVSYRKALVDFLDFFKDADIRTIKPREIGQWLGWLIRQGSSCNTLAQRLYALRAFFDRVVLLDVIRSNPARLVPMRRYNPALPKSLSEQVVVRLIDAAQTIRDRALLEVLYATGCRAAEIAGMRIEDIHWSERTVKILGKGSKERLLPFGRKAAAALKVYLGKRKAGTGFVFRVSDEAHWTQSGSVSLQRGKAWHARWREPCNGKWRLRSKCIGTTEQFPTHEVALKAGEDLFSTLPAGVIGRRAFKVHREYRDAPISAHDVYRIVSGTAHRAGLGRVHPHQLRHSAATHLLDHGADMMSIKELLGHTSISTTQIYCNVSQAHLREQMLKAHPRWQEERDENSK